MRERRDMRMLGPLIAVQRAQRTAAENDLTAAREREQAERAVQREAGRLRDVAAEDWNASLRAGPFAPELTAAFGRHLLDRESGLEQAGLRVHKAADIAQRRLQEWQRLEAQVRAGEQRQKRLRRHCTRLEEEAGAAELADRVTWSRVRP